MNKNLLYYHRLRHQYERNTRRLQRAESSTHYRSNRLVVILKKRLAELWGKLMLLTRVLRKPALAVACTTALLTAGTAQAQDFAAPQNNPFGLTPVTTVYWHQPDAVDIDNDGDLDIFTVANSPGVIEYFENTGTPQVPAFGAMQTNPFGIGNNIGYAGLAIGDLDGDGDFDILVGELYGDFRYFENTGTITAPAFGGPQVNPFGLLSNGPYLSDPSFVDIDNDGDLDIFVGKYNPGTILFYENTGTPTAPAFGPAQLNPFGLTAIPGYGYAPDFADLDFDGDFDLLVSHYPGGDLEYFENTGTVNSPAFGPMQTNPFNLVPTGTNSGPVFLDLDADGDMDLLVGTYTGVFTGQWEYYENIDSFPPLMSQVNSITQCWADTLGPFNFTIADEVPDSVTVVGTSNNQALVPNSNILLGGTGVNRTVTVLPLVGQAGTADIQLVSTDTTALTDTMTFTITVWPLPQPALGTDTLICEWSYIVLDPGQGYTTYLWQDNSNNQFFVVDGTTLGVGTYTYWVDVTDSICTNRDSIVVTVDPCVGIEEISSLNINVLPNPSKGIVEVIIGTALPEGLLTVININGQVVFSKEGLSPRESVDLSDLPKGIYVLKIQSDKAVLTKRIVIQ